jgi:hypothetical protein
MGCARSNQPLIRRLQARVAGDTTIIHCASLTDRMRVLDALMGALHSWAAELGLPPTIRVTDNPPPADPEQPGGGTQPTNGKPLSA